MTDSDKNAAPGCRYVSVDEESKALGIARGPMPEATGANLLIKVSYAGVNRADILQRKGFYPPPEDASPIMGLEVSGTVAAVGDAASEWQVGQRVCALTHGGGYADYAVAPVGQCFPIPQDFSLEEGAALPEALLTIWHNVFQRGKLQATDTVLIHGGASGMGTMGIMMATAFGARVYTTAGSAEKCARLEALGAVKAINYREADFEQVLTELGLANGINVILDMVGGEYIQKNLNLASPEGHIVNIAYMNGFKAEVNFAPLLLKRITMTGSTLRAQTFAQKAAMREEIMAQVYPHLESGAIRPIVDSSFPLEQAAKAQEHMLNGDHMGKILLAL
jgi:putative PIG3 family NAD(P)H quinone oxidoreductase